MIVILPAYIVCVFRQDLKETFIDSGVMSAIKEWIGPLPDKSLPALKIREDLLKILQEVSARDSISATLPETSPWFLIFIKTCVFKW